MIRTGFGYGVCERPELPEEIPFDKRVHEVARGLALDKNPVADCVVAVLEVSNLKGGAGEPEDFDHARRGLTVVRDDDGAVGEEPGEPLLERVRDGRIAGLQLGLARSIRGPHPHQTLLHGSLA